MHSNSTFYIENKDGFFDVSWEFQSDMSFPRNIMGLFVNFENHISEDYERGLANLKILCESLTNVPLDYNGYSIQIEDHFENSYFMYRTTVNIDEMQKHFSDVLPGIYRDVERAGYSVTGAFSGIYFNWDMENNTTDMGIALPVIATETDTLAGYEYFYINSKTAYITYHGNYEYIGAAHIALHTYLSDIPRRHFSYVVERYIISPLDDSNPDNWKTNVYYFIK